MGTREEVKYCVLLADNTDYSLLLHGQTSESSIVAVIFQMSQKDLGSNRYKITRNFAQKSEIKDLRGHPINIYSINSLLGF